ncbi:MAG: response regulator [Magnetococcales bacterium]|nr:response regulator [Magnetococcales bacterium]
MTIRKKISIILSGVIIFTGVIAAFIINRSIVTENNIEIITEYQLELVESGTEAAYHVQRIKSNIREIVLEHLANLLETEDEEGEEDESEEIEYSISVIKSSLSIVSDNINNSDKLILEGLKLGLPWDSELEKFDILKKDVLLFKDGVQLFLETHEKYFSDEEDEDDLDDITARKYTIELRNIFEDSIEPVSRKIQDEVKEIEEAEEDEMSERLEDVVLNTNISTQASTALFFILLLTGLIIHISIRKLVTKPIEQLQDAAIEIGKGNFKTKMVAHSKDEIGRLAMSLSNMANELSIQRDNLHRSSIDLRNTASRLSLATEAGNIGVWVWNAADNSLEWDDRMHTLFRVKAGTPLSFDTWKNALHKDDKLDAEKKILDAIDGIGEFNTEFRIIHPDGEVRTIKAAAIVERDETTKAPLRMVGVNWDITEQKLLESSIKEAKELAETASQSKSEFLANMSHEIRTPMNAVIGLSDLALQVDSSPQIQDYLNKISNSSRSLLRIINDILDFSKIEAGKLELEEADFLLRDIFDHLADLFRTQVTNKHLELVMCVSQECRFELNGDSLRLEQVLLNLIGNALKFTDEGEVEVQVQTNDESKDHVVLQFSIRDTGIGMTDSQIANLFQAFSQADSSTTRKFGGTGLGLSICQRLVEMMGGSIWVESAKNRGSTFYFTANFKRKLGSEDVDMVPPEDMEHIRALVVDDNFAARNALEKILAMFSFSTTGVGNGQQAITEIKDAVKAGNPYQLVVVDWFMPEMNGIQTVENIKKAIPSNGSQPKTILMTPFDRKREIELQGESIGIDQYIDKPVNCSILFDSIMDAFGKEVAKTFRAGRDIVDPNLIINKIGGAKILLVEDNAINQQVAKEILDGVAITVDVAGDGAIGVKKANEGFYDAVLMDIQMPTMDGFVATKLIREDHGPDELPIIAMTAHAMSGDREKCLQVGMNDHVTKPIDKKDLFDALMKWIKPREDLGISDIPINKIDVKDSGPAVPDTLAGIDVKKGLDRLNNNHRLYRSLLFEFYRDHADAAKTLRSLLAGNRKDDIRSAEKVVHTVKGIAGNISAKKLFSIANDLDEKLQKHSKRETLKIDKFAEALDEVVSSINKLKQQDEIAAKAQKLTQDGSKPQPLDKEKVTGIINNLSKNIEMLSFDAEDTFAQLKPLLTGLDGTAQQELKLLEEYIERIDFDNAQESLIKLAKMIEVDIKQHRQE